MNNNNKLDTLSLILDDSNYKKLIEIIYQSPHIAEDDDYHLLMMACWCNNQPIIQYLFQNTQYILKAFSNDVFKENISGLLKFNPELFSFIHNLYQKISLCYQLEKEIPSHLLNNQITKF